MMGDSLPRARIRTVFLVVLTVLAILFLPSAQVQANDPNQKLHPYLAKRATGAPDDWVDVIIAIKQGADQNAIAQAAGGSLGKSWGFVSAMQLRVPAKALKGLANHPGVRFVSPDQRLKVNLDQSATAGHFQAGIDLQGFWSENTLGSGVGVAVIDSGVAAHPDFQSRVVNVTLPSVGSWQDAYGHGTHIAGIIAGSNPDGVHVGVAPQATIYNLKVTDDQGDTTTSKVLDALEWVYNNRAQYNIRVVNLSMQSSIPESYSTSPLAGGVERLWFAGVVVVVSSGNLGGTQNSSYYPPANDPYVITVGAVTDQGNKSPADDALVSWSSAGITQDGFAKPEVLAPGVRVLSTLAPGSVLGAQYPALVSGDYIQLSGTSMAAPVVAGAAALLLSKYPSLTPDQVKHLLVTYTRGSLSVPSLSAILNAGISPAAVPAANQGLTASIYVDANSATGWSNVYFDNVYFDNVYFDNVYFLNALPVYLGE